MEPVWILVTGDIKSPSQVEVSGTRVFATRFRSALESVAGKYGINVLYGRVGKRTKLEQAVDLLQKSRKVSLIHCITGGLDVELGYALSRLFRKKLIVSVHGHPNVHEVWKAKAGRLSLIRMNTIYNFVLKRADALVFPSKMFMQLVSDKVGLDDSKSYVVPNGVCETQIVSRPRQKAEFGYIGVFARWTKSKGIERIPHLIKAAKKAGFILLWVGGKEESIIQEKLVIKPPVAPTEVPKLMDKCTIIAVPSLIESFSQVALEAMARAIPVLVSYQVGIAPLVKEYEAGEVVDFENVDDIYKGIANILEKYNKFSEGALRCARDHVWTKIAEKFIQIYLNVLQVYSH